MSKKLGFAIVGLGRLSEHQIAPALQKTKHCRLAGLVTGHPAKAKAWSKRYGIEEKHVYSYDRFDAIADDAEIDAVYIVLPNAMHEAFTRHAAKAGKHVLCEKPMAVSVEECERMIAACENAKVRLGVGYRCQLEPHHVECMRLARERVFGRLRMIEAGLGFRLRDRKQWRLRKALAGGGALMDVGIYALQAARYLTGEEPEIVSATEAKTDPLMFKEVDESICWSMRFPSGVLASCSTSYGCDGTNRFWVGAERGWFLLEDAFGYQGQHGRRSDGRAISFPAQDQFAALMDDFAQRISNEKPSSLPGTEGLADLKVIEAIYASLRQGRAIRLGS